MSNLKASKDLNIPLTQIKSATKNFETCIGRGGYGQVYKGKLLIAGKPTTVAVKRLNEQFGQGLKEFLTEIQLLSGHKHPNLISLLGYCDEGNEKIIVYEYAERGSLDKYLKCSNTTFSLTWTERLRICLSAARGLDFLHNHVGSHHRIIHRDIKSANILIDKHWMAKISDLGLSKLSVANTNRSAIVSHACGTQAYCEPEYASTGILTKESDIYSFGVVLFEVICGRLCNIDDHGGWRLSGLLAKSCYRKKKMDDIIDPIIRKQMSIDSMNTFLAVAYGCLEEERGERPTMGKVVKDLEEALELQRKEDMKSNVDKEVDHEEMFKKLDLSPPLVSSSVKELFSFIQEGILLDNGESSITWMNLLRQNLEVATNDSEGSSMGEFIEYADRLVSSLTIKVTKTLDFSIRSGASLRPSKYLLNTMKKIIEDNRLALVLSESTCENLITKILLWLLDERFSQMEDGRELIIAFNVIVHTVLKSIDQTTLFVVLIRLLRPFEPFKWSSPPRNEFFKSKNHEFSELVVKCLIKVAKVLHNNINNVNVDHILQSIHIYLHELGMEEIRKKATGADRPLRMVKTVIRKLVKIRGIGIKQHLSMIPTYMEPQPTILAYIDLNLQTLANARS